jgi:hypothetical protein
MKKIIIATLLAGSALTGAQATTVLNFDDLTGFGVVPSNYGGLNFGNEFYYYDSPQNPYNPSSPNTRIFSNYNIHSSGAFDSLKVLFPTVSTFSGAYIAGGFNTGVTITGYYLGNLVATSATLIQTATPTFLSLGYAGTVDEVRFTGYNGYYIIDDFTFDAAGSVPEPQSWALMIAGFGLVGAAMRRRKVALAA